LQGYAHTWGEQRVFFCREGESRIYSMPATWTSMVAIDPVVAIADGKAAFRADDLLVLAGLLTDLEQKERQ
jgi:Family of unknown function (DUF5372)